jgi:hypothetical protein
MTAPLMVLMKAVVKATLKVVNEVEWSADLMVAL